MEKNSGRRPLPTATKKLRGNAGKRKLNDAEPPHEPGEPELPKGLSRAAKQEWRRIVPELLGRGVLAKLDGKALGAYCQAYTPRSKRRRRSRNTASSSRKH